MKFTRTLLALLLTATTALAQSPATQNRRQADVIVYGGTSAGVIAAVQASQMGKSVIIVSPDKHLGGLSSGGLGWTDTGNKDAVGGLSRNCYERIYEYYEKPTAWTLQKREEFSGSGPRTIDQNDRGMWMFEPHVAESIFEDHVKEKTSARTTTTPMAATSAVAKSSRSTKSTKRA